MRSVPGKGSTFSFTLDLDRPGSETGTGDSVSDVAAHRSMSPPADLVQPMRVLLAEDNPVNQKVAVGLLSKRGHAVVVAGNGRDALEALTRQPFDLVLMDVQMPVMGGFEATAAIRERERATGSHIRIVAMTAHAMTGDRARCLAAGMDDYMAKPVNPKELFAMVENGRSAHEVVAAPGR